MSNSIQNWVESSSQLRVRNVEGLWVGQKVTNADEEEGIIVYFLPCRKVLIDWGCDGGLCLDETYSIDEVLETMWREAEGNGCANSKTKGRNK